MSADGGRVELRGGTGTGVGDHAHDKVDADELLLLSRSSEHRAKAWQWRMAAFKELCLGLLALLVGGLFYSLATKLWSMVPK
jgi:hypothetical protein